VAKRWSGGRSLPAPEFLPLPLAMARMASMKRSSSSKRLALGGLDHQRAVDDEREADRVGVEAVVDEALGDVAGLDAFGGLALVAEDNLVHGGGLVGELVEVFKLGADVVGVEDGVFGGLAQAVRGRWRGCRPGRG
jgi:hypothetical protein